MGVPVSNPLLATDNLPAFRAIRPEHVEPGIDTVLAENRTAIAELLASLPDNPGWDDLVVPLERLDTRLDDVWSPVRHLNSVMNTEALRAAYNACLPKLSEYASEMSQNAALFEAFDRLARSPGFPDEPADRRKLVQDALRDFHLSGVDLPEERKARVREINSRLSALTARYEENVLDATQGWTLHLKDDTRLTGVPPSAQGMLAQNARERDLEGFVITLDFPSYYAIMTHAEDRDLRELVYTAYVTRASDEGPDAGRFDNSEVMLEILRLRQEKAGLTGFRHHAERSLATKMADSPETVEHFLQDLARRARAPAESDLQEMRDYARENLGMDRLEAWDYPFVAEKIRSDRLGLSQEMLKPYFPADRVVAGLFGLVERLFGISITADPSIETWHDDVRYYVIRDAEGRERAGFYFDLYARSGKRGGAWMDVCRSRFVTPSHHQLPVAYMTCNSTPPVDGKAALFTHDEVITLFHEFGHGLHHMLTRVDHPEIAGISGVEWDAVELPSQFMENWCWEREALDLFARHHETGEADAGGAVSAHGRDAALPECAAAAAAGGVRPVRHAPALRPGSDDPRRHPADSRPGSRRGGGDPAALLQPLPAWLRAHLCRWLRGRLLQLQVGRGAVRRRLRALRGRRPVLAGRRQRLPAGNPGGRGFASGAGVVPGVPRTRAADRRAAAPQRTGGRVKIASWNVNSLKVRLPQVLAWLESRQPDVVALQETKLMDENFPVQAISDAGYRAVFSGQKTYNGVAILARSEITDPVTDPPELDDAQRRILAATVDGVRIVNLYVVNGEAVGSEKYAYKLDWLRRVHLWLKDELENHPRMVVLGDFNIAPEDRDVHDPEAWRDRVLCSEPERTALARITELGLGDCYRQMEQPEAQFSWFDYRAASYRRNRGLRIDLILASQPLLQRCRNSSIDLEPRGWGRPSDHAPVIAEFDLA